MSTGMMIKTNYNNNALYHKYNDLPKSLRRAIMMDKNPMSPTPEDKRINIQKEWEGFAYSKFDQMNMMEIHVIVYCHRRDILSSWDYLRYVLDNKYYLTPQ